MKTTTTIATEDCELDLAIDFTVNRAEPDVGIMSDYGEIQTIELLAGRVHLHDSTDCFIVELTDEQRAAIQSWLMDRCNGDGDLADKIHTACGSAIADRDVD